MLVKEVIHLFLLLLVHEFNQLLLQGTVVQSRGAHMSLAVLQEQLLG